MIHWCCPRLQKFEECAKPWAKNCPWLIVNLNKELDLKQIMVIALGPGQCHWQGLKVYANDGMCSRASARVSSKAVLSLQIGSRETNQCTLYTVYACLYIQIQGSYLPNLSENDKFWKLTRVAWTALRVGHGHYRWRCRKAWAARSVWKKDVPENSPKILATFQVISGDSSGWITRHDIWFVLNC